MWGKKEPELAKVTEGTVEKVQIEIYFKDVQAISFETTRYCASLSAHYKEFVKWFHTKETEAFQFISNRGTDVTCLLRSDIRRYRLSIIVGKPLNFDK